MAAEPPPLIADHAASGCRTGCELSAALGSHACNLQLPVPLTPEGSQEGPDRALRAAAHAQRRMLAANWRGRRQPLAGPSTKAAVASRAARQGPN